LIAIHLRSKHDHYQKQAEKIDGKQDVVANKRHRRETNEAGTMLPVPTGSACLEALHTWQQADITKVKPSGIRDRLILTADAESISLGKHVADV
jgi:hypothetical protein